MLFPTMTFALFFVVVLGIAWRLNDRPKQWRWFMLAVSYLFYGWWDWRFVFLLLACTFGNHVFATGVHRARSDRGRRTWMVVGVTFDLVLLGFFKYYGFFVDSLIAILRPLGLAPTPLLIKVTLPVGISFFLFCAISYVIDVYRREQEPVAPLDFAVYLAFFPHLVAGPIVRVSEFVPQMRRRRNPESVDAVRAVRLICRGLFKKVVIANYLATAIVDPVFVAPGQYRNWELLIGAWSYAVQIYADFSGYTDIAIGIAMLLGIRFPDNFDRPYTSTSIQEFWRRWHMTLSSLLHEYVYAPLCGGPAAPGARRAVALFITFFVAGAWHGGAWSYALMGVYNGTLVVVWRLLRPQPSPNPLVVRAEGLLALGLVSASLVFMRPVPIRESVDLLRGFVAVDRGLAGLPGLDGLGLLALAGALHLSPREWKARLLAWAEGAPALSLGLIVVVVVALALRVTDRSAAFTYFQF